MGRVDVSDLGWCLVAVIHVIDFEASEIKAIGSRVRNLQSRGCFLLSCYLRNAVNYVLTPTTLFCWQVVALHINIMYEIVYK
jgi:hypothetical protein